MFAYIEGSSFLHRRHPMVKLAVIAYMTVVVCLSYYPVFPALTFGIAFCAIWWGGKIPLSDLLKRMTVFFAISLLFILSMLTLRGFDAEPDIVLRWWIFQWSRRDIVHSITLGLRMLALVTMSMGFVLTTRPRDLVLSLMQQCRVSPVHGYAAMATYRFLPELQRQVDTIHLAQEIRGIPWNKGFLSRCTSPFRIALPLFCVAARRGERLACAMESRGLGRDAHRTYYRRIRVHRTDWMFLAVTVLAYAALVFACVRMGMFGYSAASIQS